MRRRAIRCALALVAAAAMSIAGGRLHAQVIQQAVGGVAISTEGVLTIVKTDTLQDLSKMRREALAQLPGDLNQPAKLPIDFAAPVARDDRRVPEGQSAVAR